MVKMLEQGWVYQGEQLCGFQEIANASLTFGCARELGYFACDDIARGDEAVNGVEQPFVMCSLQNVVGNEQCFGVFARGGFEAALKLKVRVDGGRFEVQRNGHALGS
jgi:hypothetical protein